MAQENVRQSPLPIVGTSDSKQSQPNIGTYNEFLNDTQLITSDKTDKPPYISSQISKIKNVRLLSESEDNKIIDSSCDFKDSLETQVFLDKELDTVVIKEDVPVGDRNNDQSTQPSAAGSSAPFKNLKLADSEGPWLNEVKDSFQETETPWLNKIKDPFKETPISEKITDAFNDSPYSAKKTLSTPSAAAHKIFQNLRERAAQKEIEVETQSAPDLFRETQSSSLEKTPAKSNDNDVIDFGNDTNEIEYTKADVSTQAFSTQGIQDTLPIEAPNHNSEPQDLKSDQTQGDIQVPGTAPEADTSVDIIPNDDQDTVEITNYDNNQPSSAINSDEEADLSLNAGRRLHSEPINGEYSNAEDSIQKYHRDLLGRVRNVHDDNSLHSKSYSGDTQRASQGKRLNSLPINLNVDVSISKELKETQKLADTQKISQDFVEPQAHVHLISSPGTPKLPSSASQKVGSDEMKMTQTNGGISTHSQIVDFNALAENITQEFSDVDDESKIDNTIDEEVESTKVTTPSNEGQSKSTNPIRKSARNATSPRKTDRQLNFTSSPENSFDQSDISAILDADSSQMGNANGDHVTSVNSQAILTPEYQKGELPTEVLKAETYKLTVNDIAFKNSVWYLDNTRYYPGLILGLGKKGLEVKFYETTTEINGGVYPLDIQIGDHLKIGRLSYVVSGLECAIQDINEEVIRCMRGYDTVIVRRLKGKGKGQKILEQEERFPLDEVRVENEEWHKRSRVLNEDYLTKPKRFAVSQISSLKRTIPISNQGELVLSTPKKPKYNQTDIFNQCIFVITGDVDKDRLTKLIFNNGGTVVEDGFASMIEFSKDGLPSSDEFRGYKFAALIAEKYLRSSKYLETVALGWPLLSQKFIYDCVSDNHFVEKIHPYLLPSGESSRLGGIAKSADISTFVENWKLGYDLTHQLQNNKILSDKMVFICSKKNIEITHFLFQILGSTKIILLSITNYTNLISTISEYSNSQDNLIYHDKIDVVKSILDCKSNDERKGKKSRKGGSMLSEVLTNQQNLQLELVDWEWLAQCVISSHPWKSQYNWSNK